MRTALSHLLRGLAALAATFAIGAAYATPIQWTLVNAVFDDGTVAAGSFTYDADLNLYSSWSISVQSGTLSAFVYDTTTSQLNGANMDADGVLFLSNGGARYVNFNFVAPLTNAGGTDAFDLTPFFAGFDSGSWECGNCSPVREFVSGAVTSTPVPEPSTVLLFGTLLAGLGFARRRRT